MNMPGFTAEVSLNNVSTRYRATAQPALVLSNQSDSAPRVVLSGLIDVITGCAVGGALGGGPFGCVAGAAAAEAASGDGGGSSFLGSILDALCYPVGPCIPTGIKIPYIGELGTQGQFCALSGFSTRSCVLQS
jgi:hypothetical protein